jgi:hypothetical protein
MRTLEGGSLPMKVDPRGLRFAAALSAAVLVAVLITGSAWLLAAQVAVFAVGALAGLRYAPYGLVYRRLIRPRLGPPAHTEAEAPPRFAQAVGLLIAGVGVICLAAGATVAGLVFAALALVAAFLNAAFDLCLGCQVYLFIQRNLRVRPSA